MPHLLNVWTNVSRKLASAARVLLLFDYDGTLTPIVARPEAATLSHETRQLLSTVAGMDRFIVGVVSGRRLGDLEAMVAAPDIIGASGDLTFPSFRGRRGGGDKFSPGLGHSFEQLLQLRQAGDLWAVHTIGAIAGPVDQYCLHAHALGALDVGTDLVTDMDNFFRRCTDPFQGRHEDG